MRWAGKAGRRCGLSPDTNGPYGLFVPGEGQNLWLWLMPARKSTQPARRIAAHSGAQRGYQQVKRVVSATASIHAAYPAGESDQLPFLAVNCRFYVKSSMPCLLRRPSYALMRDAEHCRCAAAAARHLAEAAV